MFRLLASVLVLALVTSDCRRQAAVGEGEPDQVLRIGNGEEPKDLDPGTQASVAEANVESALFEGLVNLSNDGHTRLPGVAETWDVSADGLTYTFHLRANAKWSDGSAVTADDFAYAFRRVFAPSLASANAVEGYVITGARDIANGREAKLGVQAPDARTLIVRLDYRAPYILDFLASAPFLPVQRAVVERFGGGTRFGTAWTRPGNLISNGPFMLTAWHANQEVVVTRNPYYWDIQRTRLREVHFVPSDDTEAEERDFRGGQIDVTYSVPNSKLSVYSHQNASPLHIAPELGTYFLEFNTHAAPFDDARVRRALSLAIDRENVIPRVIHEAGTAAHSLTRPGTGDYSPAFINDYDPAGARRLLAEAGYPGGKGFPAFTLCCSSSHASNLPEVLQEAWRRELGIDVKLEAQELKTQLDRLYSKNYQVASTGYTYAVNAAETMLLIAQSDSNWNFTGWRNSAYDDAFRQAGASADDSGRHTAFDRMEGILAAEAPFIPLYFSNHCRLVSPRVRGWKDNNIDQIDWRELSMGR
jgi:oligopeptide transport system substrate-binding protein